LGSLSVLFTSIYSFRLIFKTFLTPSNAYLKTLEKAHDAPFLMAFPLILLALGSIVVGFLGKDMMIGLGSNFWGNSLFVLPHNLSLLESEYIPQPQKMIPLSLIILGIIIAYIFSFYPKNAYFLKTSSLGLKIYHFLNKRWFFDKLYNDLVGEKTLYFGYHISFKTLDKGFFEILGPYGISQFFQRSTRYIANFQTGMIYHYAVVILIGLTVLISIIGIWDFLEVFVDNRLYFIFLTTFLFYNYYSSEGSNQ